MESKDVKALLVKLRDDPVDNEGATDQVLAKIFQFLMKIPRDQSGKLHWFCDHADATVVAAASFLLRLFAYDGSEAEKWKERLHFCLSGCSECVVGLEAVKRTSRTTYFAKFSPVILDNFWTGFEAWELEKVLDELKHLGASPDNPSQMLSGVPSPLVLRMVSNWAVFSDKRIQHVIRSIPPRKTFRDWPISTVPPGILLLLVQQESIVRQWASSQTAQYPTVPIPVDKFNNAYLNVVRTLAFILSPKGDVNESSNPCPFFSFAVDSSDLWAGFGVALRFIPIEFLKPGKDLKVDLRRLVSAHLSDNDTHFPEVLRCFILLLKRFGESFWADEAVEYPLVVFDAIKGNVSFTELLRTVKSSKERPWFLSWFYEYLHTLQKMDTIYGTVVAKLSDFLLEELQHERFGEVRPYFMDSAVRLLSSVFSRAHSQSDVQSKQAVLQTIDIHASILTRVAFHRDYNKSQWSDARDALRHLLDTMLLADIQSISLVITETCQAAGRAAMKKELNRVSHLSICNSIWDRLYKTIDRHDLQSFIFILRLVSKASHIDLLNKLTFDSILSMPGLGEGYPNGAVIIDAINRALLTIRAGFFDAVRNFVDYNTSSQIAEVFSGSRTCKATMLLLLSPIDDFHTAAKTLIGQAYDVDGRLECIRVLMQTCPNDAMEGLLEFLENFVVYAPNVPEACSLSKSLVRCFNDVIDVLCSKPDGLLLSQQFTRDETFTQAASHLLDLWTLMSKAIAVIFKRTPAWSIYFSNVEMVEWMRDALIFGRDMIAQWQVMENAVNAFLQSKSDNNDMSKKVISSVGQKMINCFQDVLTELSRWLRLTDEELLHQSFSLLQSLFELFRKTDIRPSDAALTKLTKYAESARKDKNQRRSRLDTSRISALEESLAFYNDDDEIQIIERNVVDESKTVPQGRKFAGGQTKTERKVLSSKEMKKVASGQAKLTTSTYFTEKDQQTLIKAGTTLPTFKRLDTSATSSTKLAPKLKRGFKDESSASSAAPSASESSESESEEEGPSAGLASLGKKFAKSPKIKKPAERRQIKTLDISLGGNATLARINQREEMRRSRMRMKPDISDLHRVLLSWDYNHDGLVPPGFQTNLTPVPDVFMDYTHFHRIYEPLLLLECWAQIVQAKDEVQDVYDCKIVSRHYVDDWLELDIFFEGSLKKEFYLAETDVVLLRHPQSNGCILAKTKTYTTTFQLTQACLRCFLKNGTQDPGLQINTIWKISKIFSLSTLHREYAALKSLPYYDFLDTILRPHIQRVPPPEERELRRIMTEYKVNEPQAAAILMALKVDGFSLIQGPPGTGKTSTICGLVSLFLANRRRSAIPIQVGSATPADRSTLPKVLLCAPSNAAIDEIARRIKDGYRGPEKLSDSVNVVRIGNEQSMNNSVKDISLDYLVDQALDTPSDKNSSNELISLRKELEQVKEKRAKLIEEHKTAADSNRVMTLDFDIRQLSNRRTEIAQKIDQLKDEQKSATRTLDAMRRTTRQKILQEADVICSTLSGAGHEIIEQLDFDMIIIDEAAQAIELSTLIPMKYKCLRCVLVGDPQQLPPTVLSQEATKFRYNQSLFVRMQRAQPDAVNLLSIQYRMHPDISRLPSRVFYQGRLKDGPRMEEKTVQPWHNHPKYGTYKFFNVLKGLEEQSGRSIKNSQECHVAVALYNRLRIEFSTVNLDYRVGVVSMYRAQIVELKRQFQQRFGKDITSRIDFNTVDGFQGQEKDIIILSCVRAGPGLQSVGFLSDTRRMNVALTRAKSSLFILGHAATLGRSDVNWHSIVEDARSRSCLVDVDLSYFIKAVNAVPTASTITKPLKSSESTATIPVPSDLFQPQDVKRHNQSVQHKQSISHNPSTLSHEISSMSVSAGTKRAADDASGKGGSDKHPPPPPAKRVKKAPNIFIPKAKQKK